MITRSLHARARRNGFTLVELLITISIIGIMSSMVLFAMFSAQETARAQKTRMMITKLNSIIMQRWDGYRTKRVPLTFTNTELNNAPLMAMNRIDCLRDLMRMEIPDRWSDVLDGPATPFSRPPADKIARPSVSQAYLNKYVAIVGNPTWPPTPTAPLTVDMIFSNQGAECLYMIVMESLAQEGDSRDLFKAGDIGDVDGDGFPEFLDAWKQPIEFIRWAPGYQSPLQTPIKVTCGKMPGATNHEVIMRVASGVAGSQKLSATPGSYVGGTLALVDQTTGIIDPRSTAQITGYSYDAATTPPTVKFICSTPSTVVELPFNGNPPNGGLFVVTQPDPFDSRGVYPRYQKTGDPPNPPGSSAPTYAIYPLIISKGGDKAMGVKDGAGGSVLRYTQENLNPFFVAPIQNEAFGLMLGSVPTKNDSEPLWKKGCHLDNISSHNLSTR